jgi:LuxR family transcriptional regulator, maltose regulon positive regulatory protein
MEPTIETLLTHALPRTLCGDAATILRWFDELPEERVARDVNLLLIRSLAAIHARQLEPAAKFLALAEALLTPASPRGQRGALLGVRGILQRTKGRPEQAAADLEAARKLVEPGTFWATLVAYQLGMSALQSANASAIITALAAACSSYKRPEQAILAVSAQTVTAHAEWWRGDPERAVALARQTFRWISTTEKLVPERPLDAFPNTILAEVHLAWNDLAPARKYAERAVEHGRRGPAMALFESTHVLARVAEAQRDWETATRAAAEAAQAIRDAGGHAHWFLSVDALAQRILLRRGQLTGSRADVEAVRRWVESQRIVETQMTWDVRRLAGLHCDTALLLAARVMMERDVVEPALYVVDQVLLRAFQSSRVPAQVEALILRAVIKERTGEAADALQTMLRALKLASKPRFVRPFVEEGEAILPLVESAAERVPDRNFAARVVAAFGKKAATPAKAAPAVLTGRDLEILRLAAAGASNVAIAERLVIGPRTVKRHVENVCAKLHVPGRAEAIARARELGLV